MLILAFVQKTAATGASLEREVEDSHLLVSDFPSSSKADGPILGVRLPQGQFQMGYMWERDSYVTWDAQIYRHNLGSAIPKLSEQSSLKKLSDVVGCDLQGTVLIVH
jgi:hypothetical protein